MLYDARFTWNQVEEAEGYHLYLDGYAGESPLHVSPNTPVLEVQLDLEPGVEYTYTISAFNANGEGSRASRTVMAPVQLPGGSTFDVSLVSIGTGIGGPPVEEDPPVPPPASTASFTPVRVGSGGFMTGITAVGDQLIMRTDVWGAYRYDRTTNFWTQMVRTDTLPADQVRLDKPGFGAFEVVIAPSDQNRVYLAHRGQLWRSDNAGEDWVLGGFDEVGFGDGESMPPNHGQQRHFQKKMAVDPANPDVCFCGTNLDGLQYTDDAGVNWNTVGGFPAVNSSRGICGIVFDPTSPVVGGKTQHIYASSNQTGYYRSTDGGTTWSLLSGSPNTCRDAVYSNGKIWYVEMKDDDKRGTGWFYDIAQDSWTNYDPEQRARAIAVDPFFPDRVVICQDNGGLQITTDGGVSLSYEHNVGSNIPLTANQITWFDTLPAGTSSSSSSVMFDPVVPGRLWRGMGIGAVYADLPADGSAPVTETPIDWQEASAGIENLAIHDTVCPPGSSVAYFGCHDRMCYTLSDFSVFPDDHAPRNDPRRLGLNHTGGIDYAKNDPTFVVVTCGDAGNDVTSWTDDDGATWNAFASPVFNGPGYGAVAVSTRQNILAIEPSQGTGSVNAVYTKDGGVTWNPVSLPGTGNSGFISNKTHRRHPCAADEVNLGTFYIFKGGTGFFRSTDGGDTWVQTRSGNFNSAGIDNFNGRLKAAPGHAGHVYWTGGGVNSSAAQATGNLWKTTDGGDSWAVVPNVLEVISFDFGEIQPSGYPRFVMTGFVGGDTIDEFGVWYSDDELQTWTKVDTYGGNLLRNTDTCIMRDGSNRLIVGQNGGGWYYKTISAANFRGYFGTDRTGIAEPDVGLANDFSQATLLWESAPLGRMGKDHSNGQVVVADNVAYGISYVEEPGGYRRTLIAFEAQTGAEFWRHPMLAVETGDLKTSPNPSPWVEDGVAYCHDQSFDYALDTSNGAVLWQTARTGDSKASPMVVDGIHIMVQNDDVVGKNISTGAEIWSTSSGFTSGSQGSPVIWETPNKNYILYTFDDNRAHDLIDPLNGNTIWTVNPGSGANDGAGQRSPTIYRDRMVLTIRDLSGGLEQLIYEVFPDSPATQPVLIRAIDAPITIGGNAVIHQGHAYWGFTRRHRTYASSIDLSDGSDNYTFNDLPGVQDGEKGYNDPVLADGKLFGAGRQQTVMAEPNPSAFTLLDVLDNNANHATSPTIVNGILYIYSYNAWNHPTGEEFVRVRAYDISAPAGSTPSITQVSLPNGEVGKWYKERLWVSSGNGSRTWSIESGSLPPGLSLNPTQHLIEGTPSSAGTYDLTLKVEDADGASDSKAFQLVIS